MEHYSVLLNESIELLNIKKDGIYVDGTLGRAGHSKKILEHLTTGELICFDLDQQAINESKEKLKDYSNVSFHHSSFSLLKEVLDSMNISGIDGMVLDLGVSSPQFDDSERGFSYRSDAKLDMRMNQEQKLSAYQVVNEYSYNQLVSILFKYGEEKFAKQIARSIEKNRPIETTLQLVEVIKKALPAKVLSKKGHPAKQTFQAIRIEVNGELIELEKGIHQAIEALNPEGRLAIITFHSLEDRIVKNIFKEYTTVAEIPSQMPLKACEMAQAEYQLVNKKPILPSEEELNENRRSHSAKLRVIEKRR